MQSKLDHTVIFDNPNGEYYEFYVKGGLSQLEEYYCTHLILTAGKFDKICVSSGGLMEMSGGYVDQLSVEDNGKLIITGGTAHVTEAGGEVIVDGGEVTFTQFEYGGHTVDKATAHDGTTMHDITAKTAIVSSGGRIVESVLNDGDYCEVNYGGNAIDITVNRGAKLVIKAGASAFSILVNPGGVLSVADSDQVDMVTVASGGTVSVVHGYPGKYMLDKNSVVISPYLNKGK